MNKEYFKCRFCKFETYDWKIAEEHFKNKHGKSLYKKNNKKQQDRFRYRSKISPEVNKTFQPKKTNPSLQEKEIANFLSQKNVYFETYPSLFVKELNKEVFPTYIIYSWNNKQFKNHIYLWIQTDEEIPDFYYIKKHTKQGRNHFILRNTEKKEQYIETVFYKFLKKEVLALKLKVEEDSKYKAISF